MPTPTTDITGASVIDPVEDRSRIRAAPLDVRLAEDTVLQPDVLVCLRADLTKRSLPATALLAVEVVSPSTRPVD